MALVDTLKLLFNVLQYHSQYRPRFVSAVGHVLRILDLIKVPSPPLQDPVPALINALLNLDLDDALTFGPGGTANEQPPKFVERLLHLLENAVSQYQDIDLERICVPLLTLIRRIYELALKDRARQIETALLPSDAERERPLGRSETLSSKLLRLSISPAAPNLGMGISALMFELSAKDPTVFVQNIGYGYAAGFLMSQKLPIPKDAQGSGNTEGSMPDVNPITGQRRDMEPQDTGPEMTDEEKEREAERLFVLFERYAM